LPFYTALLLLLSLPLQASAQRDSLEIRLQKAAELIRENRIAEAEQQINSILKAKPDEAAALNLLGTIRASQGKLNEAETLFTQAVRLDRQLLGAHMNLAYLYMLKGATEMTMATLKEVLTLAPNNLEALYKLARLQLNQTLYDDCINLLETTRQSQSLPIAFLVPLGEAYLGKGDYSKAEEQFLFVLGKQRDAVEALLGMAQVAFVKGDGRSAYEYLSRARANADKSPDLLYKYALTALKATRYDEARSAFEQLVKVNPTEAAYLLALGATWLKKPDLFEAEQVFRRALRLQPNNAQGQMYLGYTLLKQKKYSEARINLEKSIQANDKLPEPYYYLALIAQEQNEDARALELLQKLVERFPTFINPNVYVALGSSYMKVKDYERARLHLETAVKLNPDELKAHYNLAMLYARLKEPQKAQQEMQIVERLKNTNIQSSENEDLAPPTPRRNQ
jgi:Flp pilus assembly protein TadD